MRPVEVGRVDVADAQLDRFAQHGDRSVAVGRRPEDARTGELHRPVPDPGEVQVAQLERAAGERRSSSHVNRFPQRMRGVVNGEGPARTPAGYDIHNALPGREWRCSRHPGSDRATLAGFTSDYSEEMSGPNIAR